MVSKLENEAIIDFIARLPVEKKMLCEALRKLVKASMPGAIEIIAYGFPGYSTTHSSFDRIVYIAPQRDWINIGFLFGSDIPDPEKLLIGNGIRMRHVKIKTIAEVNAPALKKILKAAWAKAPQDIIKIHNRKRK